MRPRFFGIAGSCRCDANSPKRPSKTFGGPVTPAPASERGGDPALRREAGVQKLRLRTVHPALEEPGGATAGRAGGPGQLLDAEPEDLSRAHGNAERREESGRMKAAAMELPGRHAAHAAGDLVGDRDRQNRARVRSPAASRQARARPRPRDCSCARSTRCACRRTRAPATATRWRTRPSARRAPRRCRRSGPDLAATALTPRRSSIGRTASRRRRAPGRSRRGCGAWWSQRRRRGDRRIAPPTPSQRLD